MVMAATHPQTSPSTRRTRASGAALTADAALEALRMVGSDQYRADPEHLGVWHAYCPCACRPGVRTLLVAERGARVDLSCTSGCEESSVRAALERAKLEYPRGWRGGPEVPLDQSFVADVLIEQSRQRRRVQMRQKTSST